MDKDLAEIKADVKTIIEISRITRHEQENKNNVLFDFMNQCNQSLSKLEESNQNTKEYVGSVSKDLKDHKTNHFSFVKILSVAVGGLAGLAALFDRAIGWGK